MQTTRHRAVREALTLASLIFAGEAIFGLPFHVARYFRPTFVEVFDISQTQLGMLGSIYGVVAMAAYVLGGGLADRYAPRVLLSGSLAATGLSGLYLASIPSMAGLCGLFAFWGVSTILPFWSALIKATRDWGGTQQQGVAFGVLDGGRGLVASVMAMLSLFFFSRLMPGGGELSSMEEKRAALQSVIYVYTIACGAASAMTWALIPGPSPQSPRREEIPHGSHARLIEALWMPSIWLQAGVIVAAYCTYKSTDYLSQFARDIWGWSDVNAAGLSAYSSWMRPVGAIGAGLLADRLTASRTVIGCFALTALTFLGLVLTPPIGSLAWLLWMNVLAGSLGIFALRGIYFALLEESSIPRGMTGTAVGVVSFIGYTPEIFMPLLGGWLIDRWSGGATGYYVLFGFLCVASLFGIAVAAGLRRMQPEKRPM